MFEAISLLSSINNQTLEFKNGERIVGLFERREDEWNLMRPEQVVDCDICINGYPGYHFKEARKGMS